MRISFGTRLLASLALATLVTGTIPGAAHAALTPDQASCRKRVGKESRSLLKKVQKALAKCRDKMSKGQLPLITDCTTEPSTATKITKATGKLVAKVTGSCADTVVAQLVFGGDCYSVSTGAVPEVAPWVGANQLGRSQPNLLPYTAPATSSRACSGLRRASRPTSAS